MHPGHTRIAALFASNLAAYFTPTLSRALASNLIATLAAALATINGSGCTCTTGTRATGAASYL